MASVKQGLILAAGRGTRLGDLTENKPKPMVEIGDGLTAIDWILKGYSEAGLESIVIVIGYCGQQLIDYLGAEKYGLKLSYIWQNLDSYGTAAAIQQAKDQLENGPFIMSYGDIITSHKNYRNLIDVATNYTNETSNYIDTDEPSNNLDTAGTSQKTPEVKPGVEPGVMPVLLLNWLEDISKGGLVKYDISGEDDKVLEVSNIIEKPDLDTGGWNSAGVYILTQDIFNWIQQIEPSARGEYELPAAINLMLESGQKLLAIKQTGFWQDIGVKDDLDVTREFIESEKLI